MFYLELFAIAALSGLILAGMTLLMGGGGSGKFSGFFKFFNSNFLTLHFQ